MAIKHSDKVAITGVAGLLLVIAGCFMVWLPFGVICLGAICVVVALRADP